MSLLSTMSPGERGEEGLHSRTEGSSLACHVPRSTCGLPAHHSLSPAASREDKAATLPPSPSICTTTHATSVCCRSGTAHGMWEDEGCR